jgi:hypothetical protein
MSGESTQGSCEIARGMSSSDASPGNVVRAVGPKGVTMSLRRSGDVAAIYTLLLHLKLY